ncbi:SIR2 family protein [Nannocystis sp. SCPEA4]|uniref:SIR2 family NAD-dependent protein deacylase n=1 Tax=Nannocystis sp. SCPEA4 TaxID=2996787 RepID=UPI0022711E6B|nr:SIR2 family protein [Nannocystis sp. SCPEA4]MCY1057461.1 SIR2 family protein [Nannocystis sp. SCPEA4]
MSSLLADLRARYLEGRLVVFAGAGVAHAGGLPSWPDLIRHVLADAHESATPAGASALDEVETALTGGDLVRAVGELQAVMPSASYGRAVAEALDDSKFPVPALARAIADLAPTLHAVVTTTLDRFMQRAFAGEWPSFTLPHLDLGQQKHYILQLHGVRTDRSSWVLSERDYEDLLHGRPEVQRFVEGLFRFHPLLLVGYDLRDPDFAWLCGQARVLARGQAPQHFALVPAGKVGTYERRRLSDAGIELLVYPDPDATHAELLRILGELAESQPVVSVSTSSTITASATSTSSQTTTITPRTGEPTTGSTIRTALAAPAPSPPHRPTTPREALCDLLQSCFSEPELRRFVAFLPARDLPTRLSGPGASLAQLVLETALVLERDGLLTADFFARLRDERPGRAAAVTAVQSLFVR